MPYARLMKKVLLATVVVAAIVPSAHAITDEEIFRQMRLNYINPGGRALGLGGAFIAIADDATAAQANPAGLMQLAAPEFFVEERYVGSDDTTGSSVVPGFFPFSFTSSNERRETTSPTFFSYVIPWEKVALGVSRQELIKTRVSVQSIFDFNPGIGTVRWFGLGNNSVEVTNWNVALSWRPVEWISFGATGSFASLDIDAAVQNFIFDPDGFFLCSTPAGAGGGPIDCDPDDDGVQNAPNTIPALQQPQAWYRTDIDDSDSEFTYSVGILYQPVEWFSAGLVYREGAEFEFNQTRTDGLSGSVASPEFAKPDASFTHTFNLPTSYGLGLKWRPRQNWTFAADAVRINYSDLLEGLLTEQNVVTGVVNPATTGGGFATNYTVDDVTEVHVGFEYLFTESKWPWAIRGGVFHDPDNVLRDTNGFFGDALAGRDDELHFTLGYGIVVQQKFQADVAISVSDLGNEGVVSFIYRF